MGDESTCFFCGSKCETHTGIHNVTDYECPYCGRYLLSNKISDRDSRLKDPKSKFNIACILNERRRKGLRSVAISNRTFKDTMDCGFAETSVDDILNEFPRSASEFLNRSLLNLSEVPKRPFDVIRLDLTVTGNCVQIFTAERKAGYAFLRELAGQGLIRLNDVKGGTQVDVFNLTIAFWEHIEQLQSSAIGNKRAFVAMWFDESMDIYYKNGIKPAIEEAGYEPVKINLQDFNGKICDEIIVEIKRSKFIVSDFTGHRGGVYFEAGFAKGIGRPTIFTVKSDDVDNLHFDTRQYDHIVYDSPEDLKKKLFNRICATIS